MYHNGACYLAAIAGSATLINYHVVYNSAAQLKFKHNWINEEGDRSSNEMRWRHLVIGHQVSSLSNGHHGNMPY